MLKSNLLAVTAALGLAVAPVAAQAGTRAASAPVSIDASRASAPLAGESEVFKFSPLYLLLFAAFLAALIAALGGRSRG